jgi:alpha-tubulin suppressor-like RCC1 family protein
VVTVEISPRSAELAVGESVQLSAVVRNSDGNPLELTVEWTSADPAVALVSEAGVVEAFRAGQAWVFARAEAATDSVRIVVRLLFSQVSVGERHTCGLVPGGAGYCWGDNARGQLGSGDFDGSTVPVRAAAGYEFKSLAAAGGFTCGVTTEGDGYCWGDNAMMELGRAGIGKWSPVPVAVAGGLTMSSISGSQMAHACALTVGGAAWCWGYNRFGMLGHGLQQDEPEPVPVAGGLTFIALHSAFFRTCGVDSAGDVYCWGRGGPTQIGDPNAVLTACSGYCALSPVRADAPLAFTTVTTGLMHSCGLGEDGLAYCWGSNWQGQLGVGSRDSLAVPTQVTGGQPLAAISAGRAHTCALTPAGLAYCWGDNAEGQLGNASWTDSDVPVPVAGGLSFLWLSAGFDHTCAVSGAGRVYCWGQNTSGQLGTGTTTRSNVPVPVRLE